MLGWTRNATLWTWRSRLSTPKPQTMNPLTERLGGFFVFARGWSSLEVFDSGQAASSQVARKKLLPGCSISRSTRLPGSTEKISSNSQAASTGVPGCSKPLARRGRLLECGFDWSSRLLGKNNLVLQAASTGVPGCSKPLAAAHGKNKSSIQPLDAVPRLLEAASRLLGSTEKINSRLPGCSNTA